jgi:hypothetical protein
MSITTPVHTITRSQVDADGWYVGAQTLADVSGDVVVAEDVLVLRFPEDLALPGRLSGDGPITLLVGQNLTVGGGVRLPKGTIRAEEAVHVNGDMVVASVHGHTGVSCAGSLEAVGRRIGEGVSAMAGAIKVGRSLLAQGALTARDGISSGVNAGFVASSTDRGGMFAGLGISSRNGPISCLGEKGHIITNGSITAHSVVALNTVHAERGITIAGELACGEVSAGKFSHPGSISCLGLPGKVRFGRLNRMGLSDPDKDRESAKNRAIQMGLVIEKRIPSTFPSLVAGGFSFP